jgi:hypothetical protein
MNLFDFIIKKIEGARQVDKKNTGSDFSAKTRYEMV